MLVEDERWLVEDLIPRLAQAGILFTAVVVPKNQLARAITVDMAKSSRGGTSTSVHFETLEGAKACLSSRKAPES
jgi:hypothetical protein